MQADSIFTSFFGTQEGDFSIVLKSVSAEKKGGARSSLGSDSIMTEPSLKQREQPKADTGSRGAMGKGL